MSWTREQWNAYKREYTQRLTDTQRRKMREYSRKYKRNLTPEQKALYNETQRNRRHRLPPEKIAAYREVNQKWHQDQTRDERDRRNEAQRENRRRKRAEFTAEKIAAERKYKRDWAIVHPEGRMINDLKRRARKHSAPGKFTIQEWDELKANYDHRCLRCNKQEPEIKLSVDHVVPISCGGSNSIDNIQPLCVPCNVSKNAKTIDYRKAA